MVNSQSLNSEDSIAASHLIKQYQGQSLIRPFLSTKHGRQQWNFGVINPGGSYLSVQSAAESYHLVVPLCRSAPFRFSNLEIDPSELRSIEAWRLPQLKHSIRKTFGNDAANWADQAEAVARWWFWKQRKLWMYDGIARWNS